MKEKVVIILSIFILFASFKDLSTFVHFIANQDFIIANFCINQDKPNMMCSGKCYLKDELAENHEPKNKNPLASLNSEKLVLLFPIEALGDSDKVKIRSKKEVITYKPSIYSFDFNNKVFRPPNV